MSPTKPRDGLDHDQSPTYTEGECKGLRTRIEELDLERMLFDLAALTHELIQALPRHNTHAVSIYISPSVVAGRRAVDAHTEPHWFSIRSGAKDEMQVARVEAV